MENSQRKISFRAWDKKERLSVRIVKINLTLDNFMETIAFRIWDKERKKFWDSGSTPSMLKSFFENTAVLNTRDEMPYQQYTGLSDKNQVWIYEGDIVKYSGINFEVKWEFEDMGWSIANNSSELEVIGNIYDNPPLL